MTQTIYMKIQIFSYISYVKNNAQKWNLVSGKKNNKKNNNNLKTKCVFYSDILSRYFFYHFAKNKF